MTRFWISLGSNIEPERHLRQALLELEARLGPLVVSPVYATPAVGFVGPDFLNCVAGANTGLDAAAVVELLRSIEDCHGRERQDGAFASRTLDLDLLTYGESSLDLGGKSLPRREILEYAFVLAPLAMVAGDERHPVSGETYRALWKAFQQRHPSLQLTLYPLNWKDEIP